MVVMVMVVRRPQHPDAVQEHIAVAQIPLPVMVVMMMVVRLRRRIPVLRLDQLGLLRRFLFGDLQALNGVGNRLQEIRVA